MKKISRTERLAAEVKLDMVTPEMRKQALDRWWEAHLLVQSRRRALIEAQELEQRVAEEAIGSIGRGPWKYRDRVLQSRSSRLGKVFIVILGEKL